MPKYWIAKKEICGGRGDIEEGTILVLMQKRPTEMVFERLHKLPEADNVQNKIIMHQPAWWDEHVRPATPQELYENGLLPETEKLYRRKLKDD